MCNVASTTPRTNGGVRFDTLERKRRFVIGLYNFISHLELLFLLDHRILSLHCFSFVLSLMVVIYILGEIYFTPNPKYIQNCCIYRKCFSLCLLCVCIVGCLLLRLQTYQNIIGTGVDFSLRKYLFLSVFHLFVLLEVYYYD